MTADEARVHVRRDWNVRDQAGNAYGIIDVNPDPDDPAILLGVFLSATGERVQQILRLGDTFTHPGMQLRVSELATAAPAYLTLLGTLAPRAAEPDST